MMKNAKMIFGDALPAIAFAALIFAIIYMQCGMPMLTKKSYYTLGGAPLTEQAADAEPSLANAGCALGAGVGLSSSLLPREVASEEDFGQFAPDDILRGQNFLDPRQQIGFPETIGGTLRNANQQIRSEPPNPKMAYIWSNSTIPVDVMRRPLD